MIPELCEVVGDEVLSLCFEPFRELRILLPQLDDLPNRNANSTRNSFETHPETSQSKNLFDSSLRKVLESYFRPTNFLFRCDNWNRNRIGNLFWHRDNW